MSLSKFSRFAALLLCGAALAGPAAAKPFKWANDLDTTSMDPYARNVTFNYSFTGSVYEGLLRRDKNLKLEPALATEWKMVNPTTWRFSLRRGVKFHDGSPFTADDVTFSYQRGIGPGTNIRGFFASVQDVVKVDDFTVDIVTKQPNPILPNEIANWFILSKIWAEKNGVTRVADLSKNEENYAVLNANGTGPFVLKSRQPDVKTVMVNNPDWWDKKVEHNLTEVTFERLQSAQTRVAALRSGSTDMIYSVPTQDVENLKKTKGLKVFETPETRTVYLDLDQARDELVGSDVKGKNPFKDIRVRKAVAIAIDREAIKSKTMRGFSLPNALIIGPGITGYDKALNVLPKHDIPAAKKLMAEAGYPDGFSVAMECSNDRYVNDGQICQAVVGMLAQIGIKVNLSVMPFSQYVSRISPPNYGVASIAFVAWASTTYDGHNALLNLAQTRDGKAVGLFNVHGNSFPELDKLSNAVAAELDPVKRTKLLNESFAYIRDNVVKVGLHQQVVLWAAKDSVQLTQLADNIFPLRMVKVK